MSRAKKPKADPDTETTVTVAFGRPYIPCRGAQEPS